MPRALVTGASGFIGSRLVERLVERGWDVRALVRPTSDTETLDRIGIEKAVGDMGVIETIPPALTGIDVVFHLASVLKVPWRRDFETVNVRGTHNLASSCARRSNPPTLVVVSSLAAAGPSPSNQPRVEDKTPAPVSRYGKVKLASERAALELASELPMSIARPPMVFGPGDRSAFKLFRSVLRGWHVVPTREDSEVSMVYVDDLALGLISLAERGQRASRDTPDAGTYHFSHQERPSYAELGEWVAEAISVTRPRVVRLPSGLTYLAALLAEGVARVRDRPTLFNLDKYREATAGSWTCDASKARKDLGFAPESAQARLRATGDWYISRGWLNG